MQHFFLPYPIRLPLWAAAADQTTVCCTRSSSSPSLPTTDPWRSGASAAPPQTPPPTTPTQLRCWVLQASRAPHLARMTRTTAPSLSATAWTTCTAICPSTWPSATGRPPFKKILPFQCKRRRARARNFYMVSGLGTSLTWLSIHPNQS